MRADVVVKVRPALASPTRFDVAPVTGMVGVLVYPRVWGPSWLLVEVRAAVE